MGASAIPAAIADRNWEDMRAAVVSELVPVIPAETDPQTWDPRELGVAGGNVWKAVIWQEVIWHRDPDDSTTDHDELTCIVTLDGSRYKTNDVRFPEFVLSRTITEPPISGVEYGDTFLVPEGGTEDWAGKDGYRAMFTARGWKFKPPAVGELVYVADPVDLGFIHVNDQGEWEDGVGPRNLVDGSVLPRHLLIRSWQFENQTTTEPPETGPAGEQYIIGPDATGDWAGHDSKIAWRPATDAAFVITTPFVGETGFDKNLNIPIRWNGATWESAAGSIIGHKSIYTEGTGSTSVLGASSYGAFKTSQLPANEFRRRDDIVLSYRASRAGTKLRFTYQSRVSATYTTAGLLTEMTIALYRDNETTSVQHHALQFTAPVSNIAISSIPTIFEIEAIDDQEHDYAVAVVHFDNSNGPATLQHRFFEVMEIG